MCFRENIVFKQRGKKLMGLILKLSRSNEVFDHTTIRENNLDNIFFKQSKEITKINTMFNEKCCFIDGFITLLTTDLINQ